MKKLGNILLTASGWIACGFAIYWGFNHCDDKNQKLVQKLESVQTTKQNPTGTYVDEAGREHVQYRDGSTAKIPSTPAQQKAYTKLRDTLLGPALGYLLAKDDVKLSQVTKVKIQTTSDIPQSAFDSLKSNGNDIQTDRWTKLVKTATGTRVLTDVGLNSAKYTIESGIFNLKKTPMISFFSDNPNTKILGFERYDEPLPMYKPILKLYLQSEYDFVFNSAATDINASFRIGKFELGGYGRLSMQLRSDNLKSPTKSVIPSYGARITYNIKQL